MQVLNFTDFARRKAAPATAEAIIQHSATMPAVAIDRWADLHAEAPVAAAPETEERDFFADLQLRVAYPTYALRHH